MRIVALKTPLAVLLLTTLALTVSSKAADAPPTRADSRRALSAVRKWGYQLQNLSVRKAAASAADMLVIDPQTNTGRLTRGDVAALQRKPDGSRRLVFAYLSIGEAENYRPYWVAAWNDRPPAWLGPENPDWAGNFEVRYWNRDWQTQILGTRRSALDQILADGYDGAYLDIVDGFEFWEDHGVANARTRMVNWVARIGNYAREKRPEFLIIPQNGEALANERNYLDSVDGLGREDLFFDGDDAQPAGDTNDAAKDIAKFQLAHLPVFLIEYPTKPAYQQTVYRLAERHHYIPLIAGRDLDSLAVTAN